MKRNTIIISLVVLFTLINGGIYYITEINKEQRIKVALDKNLEKLEIHYKVLLYHQKLLADGIYKSTIAMPKVIEILSKIKPNTTNKETTNLRNQLYDVLKDKYKRIQNQGVLQYHFVLPDNTTFLRMHKPSKFNDDLSDIRYSFDYVNKTHKPVSGFERGRTSHAFRNNYPIFSKSSTSASDKNNYYLCAMCVDFPSEALQDYLIHIGKLHVHFLLHKNILNAKAWKRKDKTVKYLPSAEHKDYMLTLTPEHTEENCIRQNKTKLKDIREQIDKNILKNKSFSVYTLHHNDHVGAVSFYPIKNIKDKKVVAWLVSYENSEFIYTTLKFAQLIRIISFFGLLILFYFIYRVLNQKEILDIQVKEKTKELNKNNTITQKLNRELEESEHKLELINESLNIKVKEEVDKNKLAQKKLFKSEKMVAMGEMIGNIAHQWRQPLSVISTSATGMLVQKKYAMLSDIEFEKSCNVINNNAQYLSKTIDDFKNYIKGNRKKTIFNLKTNIDNFLHLVDGSIKNHHINLIIELEEDITINSYENELIQCYINIFNNAKDVLNEVDEENRFFFITTQKNDKVITIKFKDSGGGIPEDIIDKIFEPYFTTKHKSQGTGLGLHMTYDMITNGMNGTIEVNNIDYEYESKNYIGAEFSISIPIDKC